MGSAKNYAIISPRIVKDFLPGLSLEAIVDRYDAARKSSGSASALDEQNQFLR